MATCIKCGSGLDPWGECSKCPSQKQINAMKSDSEASKSSFEKQVVRDYNDVMNTPDNDAYKNDITEIAKRVRRVFPSANPAMITRVLKEKHLI